MRFSAFRVGAKRGPSIPGGSADEIDNAVLAVALQRYLITRRQHGEQLTELAATRFAQLARELGLNTSAALRDMGFPISGHLVTPLDRERLLAALYLLRKSNRVSDVHALCSHCAHLSVEQLEHLD